MKTGRSLVDLATELQRQTTTRRDYLAPASALSTAPNPSGSGLVLRGINGNAYPIRPFAHGQMATDLEIPKRYYDRMLVDSPDLLAQNVNHWLAKETRGRMIRTLDGDVRAILSDRYRPLDSFDLLEAALPTLHEVGARIVSAELTEMRLYVKATLPSLQAEVSGSRQRGDVVEAGVMISNSEIGAGAVRVEPFLLRLVCLNGAIVGATLRKFHIGRGSDGDDVREFMSTEARRADDRAFWLKARDVVRAAFNPDMFHENVARMSEAANQPIATTKLNEVVEVTSERLAIMGDAIRGSIMSHLIQGGDLTRWGLANAITRTAQDVDDYDLATDLERAGGKVIELSPTEWTTLSRGGKTAKALNAAN